MNIQLYAIGKTDQKLIEERQDVLVYSTEILEEDLEISGQVKLNLWAKTSAEDTDWAAKLVDVYEHGKSTNVCDGILRAKFNKSLMLDASLFVIVTEKSGSSSIELQ